MSCNKGFILKVFNLSWTDAFVKWNKHELWEKYNQKRKAYKIQAWFFFISFNRHKAIMPICDKSFYSLLSLHLGESICGPHFESTAVNKSADGPGVKNIFCDSRVSFPSLLFKYNIWLQFPYILNAHNNPGSCIPHRILKTFRRHQVDIWKLEGKSTNNFSIKMFK